MSAGGMEIHTNSCKPDLSTETDRCKRKLCLNSHSWRGGALRVFLHSLTCKAENMGLVFYGQDAQSKPIS